MYAELTLVLRPPVQGNDVIHQLTQIVGTNRISVSDAVAGTKLASAAGMAILAEQIANRARIVYFMAGSDTVLAGIFAESAAQIQVQCARIPRQFRAEGGKLKQVSAVILVSARGAHVEMLAGEVQSLRRRWWEALRDRFLGKFLPSVVTVGAASFFMAGTSALISAQIGAVAALVGALVDAAMMALAAGDWKWKGAK